MKKRLNPDSEANIRRIDTKPRAKKQTHGFQVHLLRGDRAITRLFSDTNYGGKEGARRAAREFKRAALGDMPERASRGMAAAPSGRATARPAGNNKSRNSTRRSR
jgi:hypothetical protein